MCNTFSLPFFFFSFFPCRPTCLPASLPHLFCFCSTMLSWRFSSCKYLYPVSWAVALVMLVQARSAARYRPLHSTTTQQPHSAPLSNHSALQLALHTALVAEHSAGVNPLSIPRRRPSTQLSLPLPPAHRYIHPPSRPHQAPSCCPPVKPPSKAPPRQRTPTLHAPPLHSWALSPLSLSLYIYFCPAAYVPTFSTSSVIFTTTHSYSSRFVRLS